jgi:hypothetical protein
MPETVTFDEDLKIVRIESYGDVTVEDLRSTLASALEMHQERGLSRGLVDATKVTSYPSTVSIFDFGSQEANQLRGLRIAIAAPSGKLVDPAFFETVTRNRGANIRVFDSIDAALAWLIEEPNKELKATQ